MRRCLVPQVILFLPPDIRRIPRFRGYARTHYVAFFEGQRPIRGYIYVPHHNFISRGPSRGRGIHDGVPAWPPDVRGTDVLPATDRRHAHPPERVRPERPWADRDLPRNPVPTRDFGPERPRARALSRDLGRHAGGTRQSGRGPRLNLHRVRIDALFLEEVERDAGNHGRLLHEPERTAVRREERVDPDGFQIAADRRHATHVAGGEGESLENFRVSRDRHREKFIAIDREMFRNRLRTDSLPLEETFVLTGVAVVRDDGRDPVRAPIANRVREEEQLNGHRVRMRGLNEDDVIARDGGQEADVSLAVRNATRVPLERHVDEGRMKVLGDSTSKRDGGRTADHLHGRSNEAGVYETSDGSRPR